MNGSLDDSVHLHDILEIIEKCREQIFQKQVERFERMQKYTTIGAAVKQAEVVQNLSYVLKGIQMVEDCIKEIYEGVETK